MIECKELNKSFNNQKDLFAALKLNKNEIISIKKSEIMKSVDKGTSLNAKPIDPNKIHLLDKSIVLDDKNYYIAVNSTRILDSHKDLHLDSIWNKTVEEQQKKNYLVDTHVLSIGTTIVRKEHIEMFTAKIPFSLIGKNYAGDTEALIYKFAKDKVIHQGAKEWLESGDAIQSSVKMRYTDISLAMKSDEKEDKEERDTYDKYFPLIANKEEFNEEILYFWGVKQAQNMYESSLVLFGSNNATGTVSSYQPKESPKTEQKESAIAKWLKS